jgi:hypothetical protein
MQMADKIIMRPVEALIPYARNARTHSEAQVDGVTVLTSAAQLNRAEGEAPTPSSATSRSAPIVIAGLSKFVRRCRAPCAGLAPTILTCPINTASIPPCRSRRWPTRSVIWSSRGRYDAVRQRSGIWYRGSRSAGVAQTGRRYEFRCAFAPIKRTIMPNKTRIPRKRQIDDR